MDDSPLARRVLQLEIALATLQSEYRGHVTLCNGRWNVIWKAAGLLSGAIALAVSLVVSYLRP